MLRSIVIKNGEEATVYISVEEISEVQSAGSNSPGIKTVIHLKNGNKYGCSKEISSVIMAIRDLLGTKPNLLNTRTLE